MRKQTSDKTRIPTEQHSTKGSHSGKQIRSTVRLDVRPHLRHVELGHDGSVSQCKPNSKEDIHTQMRCDAMRCDERSKAVMSINVTLRQASDYISSVPPSLAAPSLAKSEPKTRKQTAKPKCLGCRHSATRRRGHDVGTLSWGLQTCQSQAESPIAGGSAWRVVIILPFKRRCRRCVEISVCILQLQCVSRRVNRLQGLGTG
jgi:hypothetical protein